MKKNSFWGDSTQSKRPAKVTEPAPETKSFIALEADYPTLAKALVPDLYQIKKPATPQMVADQWKKDASRTSCYLGPKEEEFPEDYLATTDEQLKKRISALVADHQEAFAAVCITNEYVQGDNDSGFGAALCQLLYPPLLQIMPEEFLNLSIAGQGMKSNRIMYKDDEGVLCSYGCARLSITIPKSAAAIHRGKTVYVNPQSTLDAYVVVIINDLTALPNKRKCTVLISPDLLQFSGVSEVIMETEVKNKSGLTLSAYIKQALGCESLYEAIMHDQLICSKVTDDGKLMTESEEIVPLPLEATIAPIPKNQTTPIRDSEKQSLAIPQELLDIALTTLQQISNTARSSSSTVTPQEKASIQANILSMYLVYLKDELKKRTEAKPIPDMGQKVDVVLFRETDQLRQDIFDKLNDFSLKLNPQDEQTIAVVIDGLKEMFISKSARVSEATTSILQSYERGLNFILNVISVPQTKEDQLNQQNCSESPRPK